MLIDFLNVILYPWNNGKYYLLVYLLSANMEETILWSCLKSPILLQMNPVVHEASQLQEFRGYNIN